MTDNDIPPELLSALEKLANDKRPITLSIMPFEGWILMSVLQLTFRHPNLSPFMRNFIESFGRQIQAALFPPGTTLAVTAEQGWHEEYDKP